MINLDYHFMFVLFNKYLLLQTGLQMQYFGCVSIVTLDILTAHNWQKRKSTFLTCPCYEIHRAEAVGLKSSNYTYTITIFEKMWNFGQFCENLIFCQYNCLIKVRIKKILLYICDTYNCNYLLPTTFLFNFIDFQVNTDFSSQFYVSTVKSLSVTER